MTRFVVRASNRGMADAQVERAANVMLQSWDGRQYSKSAWHAASEVMGTPCHCTPCQKEAR
jgi:hypothetical protein